MYVKKVIGKYVLPLEKRLMADNILGFGLLLYSLSNDIRMKKIGVVHLNSVPRKRRRKFRLVEKSV